YLIQLIMGCSDYCKKCFSPKPGCPGCTTHWVPGCLKFLSFITCQCIKPAELEDGEENDAKCCPSYCCSCCTCKRSGKNCCIVMLYITIVLSVLLVIAISAYPTSAFIAGWANCKPYKYSNSEGEICFTITINESTGPDIVLRDTGR
uniref:Uncharacterized protein n=1 Tax=Amphimedon queenslandica TaxID=400682 RepID=A0A1X7TIJ2_AMPQE